MAYIAPVLGSTHFTCPHCGVLSLHVWGSRISVLMETAAAHQYTEEVTAYDYRMCQCENPPCRGWLIWKHERLVYPISAAAPVPNPDLPEDVAKDYLEARQIAQFSPRGAAALLRLAIQKLGVHLGESGENLNADIKNLVKKGLSVEVQQALDVVRVTGNHAVHPGQIDFDDDQKPPTLLFALVNMIADRMISEPKRIQEFYAQLPEKDRENIRKRDGA